MIGHLLNDVASIYRAEFTSDGRDGRTKAMALVGTVRVRVAQPSAQERFIAAESGAMLTHVVHLAYGADVRREDEIDVGGARRLRVIDVIHDSSRTYTRADCQVLDG